MNKNQLETITKRLSKSRIEIQSLRKNLALVKKENVDLKKRLKKSNIIHDSAPVGVCLFQQGKLVEMNRTALSMLGYSPEEIIGHEYTDIIHPDHRATIKENLTSWFARKRIPDIFEVRLITKNNDLLTCDLRMNKVRLQGRTTFIVFFANSEERKDREKESIMSRKNIALITLSSGIAGRLSQYLQPLAEGLDTLHQKPEIPGDRFTESLHKIEDTSLSIQKITRQLNRLNSWPHPPEKLSPLSINDLMQKAISIVKSRLSFSSPPKLDKISSGPSNGLSIKTFYRSKSIALLDPEEMQEAFIHLIMNACEATKESGDIFITTEEYDGFVHIYIQDSGIGIPEEIMERIFDPYYTSRGQHSGLGLSIAHSIIKRHNGSIEVTSLPDQGTTFHITLPLAESVSLPFSRGKKNRKLRDNRLLVIHNNSVIRELISLLFVDKGCKVIGAETGREGLTYINKKRFDLLITDTLSIGRSPSQLIDCYKKRNRSSPAALILPQETNTEKDPSPEINLVIRQPIDLDRLVKDVSQLLKNGIYKTK